MTEQPREALTDMPAPDTAPPMPALDPEAPMAAPEAAPVIADGAVGGTDDTPPVDPGDSSLLNLIDRLAGLLERTELTELEVQFGATGLVLRTPSAIAQPAAGAGRTSAQPAEAAASATPPAETGVPARPSVKAPLSGIWYGSPAPGSAPYVSVGGEVAVGQVIGLIEAMKLFNEIKSDLAGRVVKITADNGKLVRAKQPLIEVEPL